MLDSAGGPSFPVVTPWGIPEDYRDTYAAHWNLGIQTEFLPDTILDVAYVANRFVKMSRIRNVNDMRSDMTRPYAGFQNILFFEQAANSSYHSLQVRIEGRPTSGLVMTSAYTWGHALDDRPAQGLASQYGIGGVGIQNSYDLTKEWASSDFDVRHRYVLGATYALPTTDRAGVAGQALNGWGLNTILVVQSGRPFTVVIPDPSGRALRPDAVAGVDPIPSNQGPDNWIDPAAFSNPSGFYGTLGRNTLTGPGLSSLDFSIVKDFDTSESTRLQFRTELFNALNHSNFALPGRFFGTPGFGVVSSTTSAARQIQFGLRYEF